MLAGMSSDHAYTVWVSSSFRPGSTPVNNEVRVVDRDGRRWLQQWRLKPGGYLNEYEWVDVAELAPLPSNVTAIGGRKSNK